MSPLRAGLGIAPLDIPGWDQSGDGTPLVSRCLILEDGRTRLCVLSITAVALCLPEVRLIRKAVAEATGIAPEAILVACTHVHSGPPVFTADDAVRREAGERIAASCARAAREAAETQPAAIACATDHLPGVSRVRRVLRKDGSAITLRRACPETWGWAEDPETVGPEEPVDDRLTVLRIETLAGDVLGAAVHFACHPIPDFTGYAADLIERTLPGAVCLILNGCSGSVDTPFEQPMRGKTQAEQLPILGDTLGYRSLELLARAETCPSTPLGVTSREVFLPMDPRFRANPPDAAGMWRRAVADGGHHTEVQCLRVGDLALVGVPGEAQVGFAAQVDEVSPMPTTRVVGLANDECGYLLSAESRARGGYEADPTYWASAGDEGLPLILEAIECCLSELCASDASRL